MDPKLEAAAKAIVDAAPDWTAVETLGTVLLAEWFHLKEYSGSRKGFLAGDQFIHDLAQELLQLYDEENK